MRLSRALSDLVKYTKSVRVHDIETQGKNIAHIFTTALGTEASCRCRVLPSCSLHKQLAGIVPERDCHEPDLAAQTRGVGASQPAAAHESLPVQLQSGLQQLQPTAVLEYRLPHG